MLLSIHQPAYLPWLGYCARIAESDRHIVLDNVQYERRSFINRNKVRTAAGWCWLTVPVRTKGGYAVQRIDEVEIDNSVDWRRRHWATLRHSYGRAPCFAEHAAFFESFYAQPWTRLLDVCRATTDYLMAALNIEVPRLPASSLPVTGYKSDLILNLCQHVGATTYLSGALGRNYIDQAAFAAAAVEVRFQDYRHPEYPQVQGGFEPYMSAVDLLFNCGPAAREILLNQSAAAETGSR